MGELAGLLSSECGGGRFLLITFDFDSVGVPLLGRDE